MKKPALKISFDKSSFDYKKILNSIWRFWVGYYGVIFVITLLVVSGYSVYILYNNNNRGNLSETEKAEYLQTKTKTTTLENPAPTFSMLVGILSHPPDAAMQASLKRGGAGVQSLFS